MFGATRHLRQPRFGARVNWGHPLAAGLTGAFLFNEATTDAAINLAGQGPWPLIPGGNLPSRGARAIGSGVASSSTIGQAYKFTPFPTVSRFRTAQTASLFWYGMMLSGALAHDSAFLGVSGNASGSIPPYAYALVRSVGTPLDLNVMWNNGTAAGNEQSLTIPNAFTNDVPVTVGMTIDGTTVIGYVNGLRVGSTTTNVGTIGYTATASGYLLADAPNDNPQLFSSCAYLWDRALTAGEMTFLNADPFAPLKPAGALMPPVLTYGSMAGMQSSMVIPIMTVQQW